MHGSYATDRTAGPEHRLLAHRDDLCTVLVVPCRTPTLDADIEAMQLRWVDLGGGYGRLTGQAAA